MPDLDDQIRQSLERLTDPISGAGQLSFEEFAARRRQRAIRRAALVAAPVIVFVVGALAGISILARNNETTVATGPFDSSPGLADAVTVLQTEVVGGSGGTTQVVMVFDRPLPSSEADYVDDITTVDQPSFLRYTTQDPEQAHVCGDTHDFGAIAEGTVDLLIPAEWFAEGVDTHTSPLERIGEPPKFVVCGPYRGFYQYSIWGPASAESDNVTVQLGPDRTRLVIDIVSPAGTNLESDEAASTEVATVADFEQACRNHLDEVQQRSPATAPSGDGVKVFEPRFVGGPRTVVLFDDERIYSCVVRGSDLGISESGGSPVDPTEHLADDQVQVLGQTWSGGDPDGSCAGGQPCGPGSASYFGRVGAGVTSVGIVLLDQSFVDGSIEPDRWFIAHAQIPPGAALLQQRIAWTLQDGTELEANPADLTTPTLPDGCSNAATAVLVGDTETLAAVGIPAQLPADLIQGQIDLRLCGSDNTTGEFVLVIGRTSEQIFVLRNTTRNLLTSDEARVVDAINIIGDRTGALMIAEDTVTALTDPPDQRTTVPVAALFEDGND